MKSKSTPFAREKDQKKKSHIQIVLFFPCSSPPLPSPALALRSLFSSHPTTNNVVSRMEAQLEYVQYLHILHVLGTDLYAWSVLFNKNFCIGAQSGSLLRVRRCWLGSFIGVHPLPPPYFRPSMASRRTFQAPLASTHLPISNEVGGRERERGGKKKCIPPPPTTLGTVGRSWRNNYCLHQSLKKNFKNSRSQGCHFTIFFLMIKVDPEKWQKSWKRHPFLAILQKE